MRLVYPAGLKMAKVIHEKNTCVGCGACAAVCPKYWEMGGDGKSHLKGSAAAGDNFELTLENVECNTDAANACPVKCIKIEE
jgi:ferredoxin